MLRLEGVGRRFGSGLVALSDVDLGIEAGEVLALLGPSGCGKSSLLRLIAGLDRPDAGRITWDAGKKPAPGRIGMVFQDPVLLPWAGAAANVGLPLRLRGAAPPVVAAQAAALLAEVGLADFFDARPRALSGGMRMRVALARALSTDPDLLLMDEPFAALDEPTRHGLQDDLRALHQRRACTIVFVTHSIYEAVHVATRIAVMSARPGRIKALLEVPPHGERLDAAALACIRGVAAQLAA